MFKLATVRPFRAVRPRREQAAEVTSPPYDVLNSKEARKMAEGNPISLLHVTKPEIDLDPGVNQYDDKVYNKAKENMKAFLDKGVLFQDEKPMFYLYRQEMPVGGKTHVQVGLVACASVDEYERNVIKKHELTRKDKEDDRTRHVFDTKANTGPVFLVYNAVKEIDALFEEIQKGESEYDFTGKDGIRHILWLIGDDATIAKIQALFKEIPVMYVADGHHRSASAMRVRDMMRKANPNHTGEEEYNFFLAVIFPHDQMNIMAYNRVLKNLHGHTEEEFMKLLGEKFDVKEAGNDVPSPSRKHEFGMYMDGKGYVLTPKAGTYDEGDPVASLDVAILQNNLLDPVLGIKNPREDKNIDFIGGIRGNGELKMHVDSKNFKLAFSLYPTSIEDLIGVADGGKIMPPKSTWFEPKLKDGMAIHMI